MKRYDTDAINGGEMLEATDGYYVEFTEAQAEIDSRDKRITEQEAAHLVQFKVVADKLAERDKHIAELEAALAATAVLP